MNPNKPVKPGPQVEFNHFMSFVTTLANPNSKQELKFKCSEMLNNNLETIMASSYYGIFLSLSISKLLDVLKTDNPYFITDHHGQKMRKLTLTMLLRISANAYVEPYIEDILSLMFHLIDKDNETNVLICAKIIFTLYNKFKPSISEKVLRFIRFVQSLYANLPNHMDKLFESGNTVKVNDWSEVNIEEMLEETYIETPINTEKRVKDVDSLTFCLIPKSVLSLRVKKELLILVHKHFVIYKNQILQYIVALIPMVINTIILKPTLEQRQAERFNKEVLVELIDLQNKCVSFVLNNIASCHSVIIEHSPMLVKGIVGLLTSCPVQAIRVRRETILHLRNIVSNDILRSGLLPHMKQLFNEDILLGQRGMVYDSVIPIAYSTLGDLVLHVRYEFSLDVLRRAFHFFSVSLLDDNFPINVQVLSCKALNDLADPIRIASDASKNPEFKKLLLHMLKLYSLKLKRITKIHLPLMLAKCKQQQKQVQNNLENSLTDSKTKPSTDIEMDVEEPLAGEILEKALDSLQDYPQKGNDSGPGFPINDYKRLLKTLISGAKSISNYWLKLLNHVKGKPVPNENQVFVHMFKYVLLALDIYTINAQPNVITREERDLMQTFAGTLALMNPQAFHEVCCIIMQFLMARYFENCNLQILISAFLSNPTTSPIFGSVLVEYLLKNMAEMQPNSERERSSLYLKLFKLLFESISVCPKQNQNMLKPYIHQIVNRSLELGMTVKEPYCYCVLLRDLFKSLSGSAYDILYQEFNKILPTLYADLTRMQRGIHLQQGKELLVELCLIVPVMLSQHVVYLSTFLPPIISALNGSLNLRALALNLLRTYFENIRYDFIYEQMHPVRSELMQALWKITRSNDQNEATAAFKLLGHFGGHNRTMTMIEPQKLEYIDYDIESMPFLTAKFHNHTALVEFPVYEVIKTAYTVLKMTNVSTFYRKKAWEAINCYLAASRCLNDDQESLIKFFLHPCFQDPNTVIQSESLNNSVNKKARQTHQTALAGMFFAVLMKELKESAMPIMKAVVRYYTMLAIGQQSGLLAQSSDSNEQVALDPLVLVDALAVIMGSENIELCKPGHLALVLIFDTAEALLASKEMVCKLPLIEYLSEEMIKLCYYKAWYAKYGGCMAVKFLIKYCTPIWVFEHLLKFIRAMFYIIMDLTGEVSGGASDEAQINLKIMLNICVVPLPQDTDDATKKAQENVLQEVTRELILQVAHPHAIVREVSISFLRHFAEKENNSVASVVEPSKDILIPIVSPINNSIKSKLPDYQLGFIDANTFCNALNPRLVTYDMNVKEHEEFITDLLEICNLEDCKLKKWSYYETITDFIPLKTSALKCLATCHYIDEKCDEIFEALYNLLRHPNEKLQELAYRGMNQFNNGHPVGKELIHNILRPILSSLGDVKNLTLEALRTFSYLTQLFPLIFNEKLCEQFLEMLRTLLDNLLKSYQTLDVLKKRCEEKKIVVLISLFHQIPATSCKFVGPLCRFVLQSEQALHIQASLPFSKTLMKFLLRYPIDTMMMLLHDNYTKDKQYNLYLEYLLKHKDGRPFREYIKNNMVLRLMTMLQLVYSPVNNRTLTPTDRNELQYQSIRIISILIKYDEFWLTTQPHLVNVLKELWCNDAYHERHRDFGSLDYTHWKEPKLLAKILLHYFGQHTEDIDLLFQILRVFCYSFVPDLQFLHNFLEKTVAEQYSLEWKRYAFFRFSGLFLSDIMSEELKSKVIKLILIPCFAVSFEKGETDELLGNLPRPYSDVSDNIASVFIDRLIDPDNPKRFGDCVTDALLQFSCLLVEKAPQYIKPKSAKLIRLITFAWPCLLEQNCDDQLTKYHGCLLLSHTINKYSLNKQTYLPVFHALLKAHEQEAREIVRQAFEVLIPAIQRTELGNESIASCIKKVIIDEGHSVAHLVHIMQLIVRHYKLFYPIRQYLMQQMIRAIQKLGFNNGSAKVEHRKLAIALAGVILIWEQTAVEESDKSENVKPAIETTDVEQKILDTPSSSSCSYNNSQPSSSYSHSEPSCSSSHLQPSCSMASLAKNIETKESIEKTHITSVVNLLLRLACQVDTVQDQVNNSLSLLLPRHCVLFLRSALQTTKWSTPIHLKLDFLGVILMSASSENCDITANFKIENICAGLELLIFLLEVLEKDLILHHLKQLNNGIALCLRSTNNKIMKLMYRLISKLMSIFPVERTNSIIAYKHAELEPLYLLLGKIINDDLTLYVKNQMVNPSSLYGPVMLLKATCATNYVYIDIFISLFITALRQLTKLHLQSTSTEYAPVNTELLILSLDLVRTRVSVMNTETKKLFIGTIVTSLIENTTDISVMMAIFKMLEEWMKNQNQNMQPPSMKDKTILLEKMMTSVNRFSNNASLTTQFIELVNFIYSNESLKNSELCTKLETSFLSGLKHMQPHIRIKFFQIFDSSIERRLYNRLLYIVCNQNWEKIGTHYWIKQCIELLLETAVADMPLAMSNRSCVLPSITSMINNGAFVIEEKSELDQTRVIAIMKTHHESNETSKGLTLGLFMKAAAQLCHLSTTLAEKVWIEFFPSLWGLLEARQRTVLHKQMVPFLLSGIHNIQSQCQPSALKTFVEALSRCHPSIHIPPAAWKILGKHHNLWHRAALELESMACNSESLQLSFNFKSFDENRKGDTIDLCNSLSYMYSALYEEDLWAAFWQKCAHYPETRMAMVYEQHGCFEEAYEKYHNAMTRHENESIKQPTPMYVQHETKLWVEQLSRCSKELALWDQVLVYGRASKEPLDIVESAWRLSEWDEMKEVLATIDSDNCPRESNWKMALYEGFLSICQPSGRKPMAFIDHAADSAVRHSLIEWKRLPHIVSHMHFALLQAAELIVELQQAQDLNRKLIRADNDLATYMNTLLITRKSRLPAIADDLSHWHNFLAWRQQHANFIVERYGNASTPPANSISGLALHALAESTIQFAKIARKHKLIDVSLDMLNTIHGLPSVRSSDCFQKICQQLKCHIQLASVSSKRSDIQHCLDVVNTTDFQYFSKEQKAILYAIKGSIHGLSGNVGEAMKTLSDAVQLHDSSIKAWGAFGDHLEASFTRNPKHIDFGSNAIVCFLHACKHLNEPKARKYIAKVLWLLSFDNEEKSLMNIFGTYSTNISPIVWLPWIPQLTSFLIQCGGDVIVKILSQIGSMYCQAVYFPVRVLYRTLRTAATRNSKASQQLPKEGSSSHSGQQKNSMDIGSSAIKATPAMQRCTKILTTLGRNHNNLTTCFEKITDQMEWFRESWYEDVLRQLRHGLTKCYAIAFENKDSVDEAKVPQNIVNFLDKLKSSFSIVDPSASQTLAAHAEATSRDPVFIKMKMEFAKDFDFSQTNSMKLHELICNFKKWISMLDKKSRMHLQSSVMRQKCNFLLNFTLNTADIALPGEYLLLNNSKHIVKIAQFMPQVDVIQKYNATPRRLYIRGDNGKIYPYLVIHHSGLSEANREESVLQLLRMLNHYLGSQKETARRLLHYTVPKAVLVSPNIRLVEDNPRSLSLMDIYKKECGKLAIEHDEPIKYYYERLEKDKHMANHKLLKEVLEIVQTTLVPRTLLKRWAVMTFKSPTDYWQFRKLFTLQMALACFAEYVFYLTRLNPDMMYVHVDTGLMNVSHFKFDINYANGQFNPDRPILFRLTPNIAEFMTPLGVIGPFTASMIALARCLAYPNFMVSSILKPILKDEFLFRLKREPHGSYRKYNDELLINVVNKAISLITNKLNNIAEFEKVDNSKVATFIEAANSPDNLCRMDPAWHPWL